MQMDQFIRQFYVEITNNILAEGVLDNLYAKKIFTWGEVESIKLSKAKGRRKFLRTLRAKHFSYIPELLDTLKQCTAGQDPMIAKMETFYQEQIINKQLPVEQVCLNKLMLDTVALAMWKYMTYLNQEHIHFHFLAALNYNFEESPWVPLVFWNFQKEPLAARFLNAVEVLKTNSYITCVNDVITVERRFRNITILSANDDELIERVLAVIRDNLNNTNDENFREQCIIHGLAILHIFKKEPNLKDQYRAFVDNYINSDWILVQLILKSSPGECTSELEAVKLIHKLDKKNDKISLVLEFMKVINISVSVYLNAHEKAVDGLSLHISESDYELKVDLMAKLESFKLACNSGFVKNLITFLVYLDNDSGTDNTPFLALLLAKDLDFLDKIKNILKNLEDWNILKMVQGKVQILFWIQQYVKANSDELTVVTRIVDIIDKNLNNPRLSEQIFLHVIAILPLYLKNAESLKKYKKFHPEIAKALFKFLSRVWPKRGNKLEASKLINLLGRKIQALQLAASHMETLEQSLQQYTTKFTEAMKRLARDRVDRNVEVSVAINISIEWIKSKDHGALATYLVNLLAYIDNESASKIFLGHLVSTTDSKIEQALKHLQNFALIQIDDKDVLKIDRLVSESLRLNVTPENENELLDKVLGLIDSVLKRGSATPYFGECVAHGFVLFERYITNDQIINKYPKFPIHLFWSLKYEHRYEDSCHVAGYISERFSFDINLLTNEMTMLASSLRLALRISSLRCHDDKSKQVEICKRLIKIEKQLLACDISAEYVQNETLVRISKLNLKTATIQLDVGNSEDAMETLLTLDEDEFNLWNDHPARIEKILETKYKIAETLIAQKCFDKAIHAYHEIHDISIQAYGESDWETYYAENKARIIEAGYKNAAEGGL